jgi:hypothetical protein
VHGRDRTREGNQRLECGGCVHSIGINKEILNWPGPPWEVNQRGVKRSGRDEPFEAVIHICMETTQGKSLFRYLYLKLAKMPCFSF